MWKPHSGDPVFAQELEVNREILLLRGPRWLQCFFCKYWFSCMFLPYLLSLTIAFCYGLVWAFLKSCKTERNSEMKREIDWHCIPQRSGFPCSYSGAVLRCCCRRKSGQGVSSTTGDHGQWGILLLLSYLPSSLRCAALRGQWQISFAGSWCHRGGLLIQKRLKASKRKGKCSAWYWGTELDPLKGTARSIPLLLWVSWFHKWIILRWNCACVLTLIQIVIIFVFTPIFLPRKRTRNTGTEGSLNQKWRFSLIILNKLNEEKRSRSIAVKGYMCHITDS